MAGHVYITVNAVAAVVYVEGSYDEEFTQFIKSIPWQQRAWEPEAKRWRIDRAYTSRVVDKARQVFSRVYFGRGGDYEEITIGDTTYQQENLFGRR